LCEAGQGFIEAYKDVRGSKINPTYSGPDENFLTTSTYTTFMSEICKLVKENNNCPLLVVGHSLGGAMAQLFAAEVSSHLK
jgi:hypothetical protein